ncbi:MAG TPA: hypothetical protein VMU96_00210, partial [Casimicrobiaceae bacterium]|nr:hypothetical protein [Casimicrobiaceae bacterium]
MKHRIVAWIAAVLVVAAGTAVAEYHTFQIEQIFSNANGSVQFIVMHEMFGQNGENFWMGNQLTIGANAFTFNKNLPGGTLAYGYGMGTPSPTANKRVLIATQGFAALGIVTPDFVVPNGFLPTAGGTLSYAGVDSVTFGPLPTDGVTAINRNAQSIPNLATNFAGQSASVTPAAPPANITPLAGAYYDPAESGSGFTLDYQNGTLVVASYSFLPSGAAQWYLSSG